MDDPEEPVLRRDARENRERVLVEAAAVFAEHGLAATLADVAKAAGVGVGTLYRRFPDKDELILAVYRAKMERGMAIAELASTAADPGAAFRVFIEKSAEDFAADRGFRELVLGGLTDSIGWARSGPSSVLVAAVDGMNVTVRGHLEVLIERAKAAGALRADLEPTDVQLINAAVQAIAAFGAPARPGIQNRMITMILEGLQPRADQQPIDAAPFTEDELRQAIRSRWPSANG